MGADQGRDSSYWLLAICYWLFESFESGRKIPAGHQRCGRPAAGLVLLQGGNGCGRGRFGNDAVAIPQPDNRIEHLPFKDHHDRIDQGPYGFDVRCQWTANRQTISDGARRGRLDYGTCLP